MSATGEKEKTEKEEEKDVDTKQETDTKEAAPKSAKSPKTSRNNSAKKGTPGPKSPRARSPKTRTPGSPKSARKSGKKSGKSSAHEKDAGDAAEESDLPQDLQAAINAFVMPEELPPNVEKLFVASQTQALFSMVGDKDVTAEKPIKLIPKADILADLHKRAAVCDFSVFKKNIQNYPEELLLLVYDADFKFGENFIIALTPEAKAEMLPPPKSAGEGGPRGLGDDEEEEEDDRVYTYIPPVPKDWVSQGSEKEIKEECLVQHRQRSVALFLCVVYVA